MARHRIALLIAALLIGWLGLPCVGAQEADTFDTLLAELRSSFGSSQNHKDALLEKLTALQPTFTPDQKEQYHLIHAHSLGERGKHRERVALVESHIGQVKTPIRRARFLYELIDGYTALGQYEKALQAMNESILLLPDLQKPSQKIVALQGALNLLSTLRAYDEALEFADRIYALRGNEADSYAACVGLSNKVETNYMRGHNDVARAYVADAIRACDANKNEFFTLIVKALAAIDLLESDDPRNAITAILPLLRQFSVLNNDSDYVIQLQEAIARAYLKSGNTERAEHYGLLAYQRAQSGGVLLLQDKTSETLGAIKRSQGQLAAALGYYDVNLDLKKKVLDDQLHKNLAYQRAKFEAQDKTNQLALLEQTNKNLGIEKELQKGRYQNLVLLMTLGLIALVILGTWLAKALQQKNLFRHSAQVDGLTQASNRAHFTACAQQAFKDHDSRVSLVLMDMDFFKRINDTYGHATGDWVLKSVCDTVKAQLRKTDSLGRLGGEEFAICLPQFTEDEVRAVAERCRLAIAAIDTRPSGFHFALTASFGIATRDIGGPLSFEETLAAADKALYLSKNEGRNRVTVYHPTGA